MIQKMSGTRLPLNYFARQIVFGIFEAYEKP